MLNYLSLSQFESVGEAERAEAGQRDAQERDR